MLRFVLHAAPNHGAAMHAAVQTLYMKRHANCWRPQIFSTLILVLQERQYVSAMISTYMSFCCTRLASEHKHSQPLMAPAKAAYRKWCHTNGVLISILRNPVHAHDRVVNLNWDIPALYLKVLVELLPANLHRGILCCHCMRTVDIRWPQPSTAQHSTAQHSTAQHSTAQPSPAFWEGQTQLNIICFGSRAVLSYDSKELWPTRDVLHAHMPKYALGLLPCVS